MEYGENGESFLQLQYMTQQSSSQSNNDWNAYDATTESDSIRSKMLRRWKQLRRTGGGPLCCLNCKLCVGLLIGALIASIALAAVLTLWLKSSSGTTTTTTSTTSTSASTTSTSTTSTTTSTTSTSTTSTTTSTSATSTTTSTTSTSTTSTTTSTTSTSTSSTSTSTTSTTSSTSTTSTSTSTTSTSDTTTTSITTAAPTASPYTPSTVTCSSTGAPSCAVTVTTAVTCQSYEVSWNGRCYYLDGSGGSCITGYNLATNDVLICIATNFTGKTYQSTVSSNCCIWTADTYECYGLGSNCNSAGPFTSGPTLNGAGCLDAQNQGSQQLTFCGSI